MSVSEGEMKGCYGHSLCIGQVEKRAADDLFDLALVDIDTWSKFDRCSSARRGERGLRD